MRKTTVVQELQAPGQSNGDTRALCRWKPSAFPIDKDLVFQGPGCVGIWGELPAAMHIVGQFHHIAEVPFIMPLPHIENP
jgi:hypothetical protein